MKDLSQCDLLNILLYGDSRLSCTSRGVHDLGMDGGPLPARFSERYPLLITETCYHTHFYDEFLRKTAHFWLFFANFWITHPCLWKICRKRDPCLENFGPNTHPYWRHIPVPSTCYVTPPPRVAP